MGIQIPIENQLEVMDFIRKVLKQTSNFLENCVTAQLCRHRD